MPAPKGNKYAQGNKGGGRKSTYKKEYAKAAAKLYELGATDFQVAEAFSVSSATIRNWQAKHKEFSAASKTGKELSDDRVERSLFHKACGYTFESEKIFNHQGEIVRATTVEHVPPDTTAAIFWLKNRRKEEWRDKHEVDHNHKIDLAALTDDELEDIAAGRSKGTLAASTNTPVPH